MKGFILRITFALVAFSFFTSLNAQDYVAIAKNGFVYDDANAKYITVNQNNDDVAVIPGMVFVTTQHTPGWYKIEYSPGIHAFIPDQITASSLKPLKAGVYELANLPGKKIEVQGSGDNWNALVDGESFQGVKSEEILVFVNNNKNIAYSLVDLGNGPIAITYDNATTKFF